MTRKETREPGIFRIKHLVILLIIGVVAAAVCAGYYPTWQASQAAGKAKDLFFCGTDYLLSCNMGNQEFKYDRQDRENYYITNAKRIGAEEQKNSEFVLIIEKESKIAARVEYTHTAEIMGYTMTATGVYPAASSSEKGGVRWSKTLCADTEK